MTNRTKHLFCFVAASLCANAALAVVPLDEGQLGDVWGQALLELANTSSGGQDFSRITLNADISLSANFKEMRLGQYAAAINGTGADIDIKTLQFGRNPLVVPPGGDANLDRVVKITNPYFEFVYKSAGDPANREVVGMRLGFGSASGYLGTQIRSLSGSIKADISTLVAAPPPPPVVVDPLAPPVVVDPLAPVPPPVMVPGVVAFDSGTGTKRSDGTAAGTINPVLLSTVGEFKLGNADGPTRDFFIGIQTQAVAYTANGGISSPTAQAGFWLNMRDRVSGTVGDMPSNQLRPAAPVKW